MVAVGEGVTQFKQGDRVQSAFFTNWEEGPPRMSLALGDGMGPGMLAELVVLPETGVVQDGREPELCRSGDPALRGRDRVERAA